MIYGLPLLIGGAIVWLANNGLRFVVEAARGAEAVGLVTVGWGLGLRAAAFAAMMVAVAGFPLAVRRAREEGMDSGQAQLVRNGVLLLATLAPATAGLWAISSPLIDLAVAEEYRSITKAVVPLALVCGTLRNIRQHFSQHVFLLHEKPNIPVYNDIVDATATLAGVAIGLWLADLPGAVAGAAAGAAVGLAFTAAWGWRSYRFALPLSDIARVGAATLAMVLSVKMFAPTATPVSLLLAIALGGIVYAGILAMVYPAFASRIRDKISERLKPAFTNS
jgi:O-antigen/teichoic acid export membrane protein